MTGTNSHYDHAWLTRTPKLLLFLVIMIAAALLLLPMQGCSGTPAPATAPGLIRYPYLQQVTQTSALIIWTTKKAGTSEVHYGPDQTRALVAPATADSFTEPAIPSETSRSYYVHVAHLNGLQPGTTYYYSAFTAGTDVTSGGNISFHTDPGPAQHTLRMLIFGDSGSGNQSQFALRDTMLGRTFDLALHTGDVVYPQGTYQQFDSYFFTVYKDLASRLPFYVAMGNHDYETLVGRPYLDDFYLPENALPPAAKEHYYSFDFGPAHFVSLDSEILAGYRNAAAAQQMLDWLNNDLAHTSQPWKIVFFHRPPYSSSNVSVAPNLTSIAPILQQHRVDIVFDGHEHIYARTVPIKDGLPSSLGDGGIIYVTTGGGGGDIHLCQPQSYTAICLQRYHFLDATISNDCLLAFDAVSSDGEIIDHFALDRCNPATPSPTATSTP